jgi:hypothetical protein
MAKRPAERTFRIGKLVVAGSESTYALACDRAAVAGNTLHLASVVGDGGTVKGFGAALHTTADSASFRHKGLEFLDGAGKAADPNYIFRCQAGYRRHLHRLDYGRVHAIFVSKDPTFLPSMDPESIWQALAGPRYTTPLLRPWAPWLTRELARAKLLVPCLAHRARCGLLLATTDDLDTLISDGIRSGALPLSEDESIREPEPELAESA